MSVPRFELKPRLGVRKPDLRRSLVGKLKMGEARIGTPLKNSVAELAVAISSRPSNSIDSACTHHALSPGPHVVNRAFSIRARSLPRNSTSAASPRPLRAAYVKLASGIAP